MISNRIAVRKKIVGAILSVVFVVIVLGGIWHNVSEKEQQRRAAIHSSEIAAAAHVCEPWKVQAAQFNECTEAYAAWERCESKRVQLDVDSHGVICEHPIYQFHARDQAEIDRAMVDRRLDSPKSD